MSFLAKLFGRRRASAPAPPTDWPPFRGYYAQACSAFLDGTVPAPGPERSEDQYATPVVPPPKPTEPYETISVVDDEEEDTRESLVPSALADDDQIIELGSDLDEATADRTSPSDASAAIAKTESDLNRLRRRRS